MKYLMLCLLLTGCGQSIGTCYKNTSGTYYKLTEKTKDKDGTKYTVIYEDGDVDTSVVTPHLENVMSDHKADCDLYDMAVKIRTAQRGLYMRINDKTRDIEQYVDDRIRSISVGKKK